MAELHKKGYPLISVILPVHNGGDYITDAIQSILNQTESNFELIIINDASTDNTTSILEKFSIRDSRIKIIEHVENWGLVKSLNQGIDIAQGNWIARMDADDVSLPDRFSSQIKFLTDNNADLGGTWIKCIGESFSRVVEYPTNNEEIRLGLIFETTFAHPTIMARSDVFKKNLYDDNYTYAEDYELWLRLARNNEIKMVNLPLVKLHYRIHHKQSSALKPLEQIHHGDKARIEYMHFLSNDKKFPLELGIEIIKMRHGKDPINANKLCDGLLDLSKIYSAIPGKLILKYIRPLYVRSAKNVANITNQWLMMSKIYSGKSEYFFAYALGIIGFLKLNPDSKIFRFFEKLYLITQSLIKRAL